jgi:glycosyltransferase involved in cell wall biosynthesis
LEEVQLRGKYKYGDSKVIVGIPCYNEEKTIAKVILQAKPLADEIVVADDGSTDMTAEIARAMGARVIRNEKNEGKGVALRMLFMGARESDAGVLVTIDGDGQHDCRSIPNLVYLVLRNGYDIAVGSRFESKDDHSEMPKYRQLGSNVINGIVSKSSGLQVKDTQSGFRAYGRKAILLIQPGEHGFAVESEILHLAAQEGLTVKEIPTKIKYKDLGPTSTKNPVSHSTEVIASTIKFASLRHPLVFYGIPSLTLMLVSVIFGIWAGLSSTTLGHLPFGPTVATVGIFIVAVILGAVAIILYSLTTIVRENARGTLPWLLENDVAHEEPSPLKIDSN